MGSLSYGVAVVALGHRIGVTRNPHSVRLPAFLSSRGSSSRRLLFSSSGFGSAESKNKRRSGSLLVAAAADSDAPKSKKPKGMKKPHERKLRPYVPVAQRKRPGLMVNNKAVRDFKRRQLVKQYEHIRAEYKAKIKNKNLPLEEREEYRKKLHALPRDSSKVRLVNRCFITGRARGVYRWFGLSRHCIRELASQQMLPGIQLYTW